MNFQKEIIGVTLGSYAIDSTGHTITVTSEVDVTYETLLSIANITRGEWYYITPGDQTNLVTGITSNTISIDDSTITWADTDKLQIIVAVDDTTKDADGAFVRSVQLNQENEIYQDPIELVAGSDIGTVDDTYKNQGSRIDVRGYNVMILYVAYVANDSTGSLLEVRGSRTDSDTNLYRLASTLDYQQSLDSFGGEYLMIPFDVTGYSFVQVRTKATSIVGAGSVEGTVTIDFALAND